MHLDLQNPIVHNHINKFNLRTSDDVIYQYRTISLDDFKTIELDMKRLHDENLLSSNSIFRSYIAKKNYNPPADFSNAKSLILFAKMTLPAIIKTHHNGIEKLHNIPPQYYHDSFTLSQLEKIIQDEIIIEEGYKIQLASQVHLKHLAVRSGLGFYGRNNICYVPGMGSYITLFGYFTDFVFPKNPLSPLSLMPECQKCSICTNSCPTSIIGKENFVIDVDHCITLYNEIPGEFPKWSQKNVHNALMGCWKCQKNCLGNKEVRPFILKFPDLTDLETTMVLNGDISAKFLSIISQKLKMFQPENVNSVLPTISRNLNVLIYE